MAEHCQCDWGAGAPFGRPRAFWASTGLALLGPAAEHRVHLFFFVHVSDVLVAPEGGVCVWVSRKGHTSGCYRHCHFFLLFFSDWGFAAPRRSHYGIKHVGAPRSGAHDARWGLSSLREDLRGPPQGINQGI